MVMIIIKILLINLLIIANSYSLTLGDSMSLNSFSSSLSSGLNPSTYEPLPDSDWLISYSSPNRGSCNEFSSSGYIYNSGLVAKTDIQYADLSNTTCSGITVSGDIYNTVSFYNMGMVQESFFPTENLTCSISTSCDINFNVNNLNKSFATFNPTNGENGTVSGKINLFVYNYNNLTVSSSNGTGGASGKANMSTPTSTIKYCVYKRDLTTDGNSSTYAKTPQVELQKINWTPYQQGPNGSSGTSASGTANKTKIIKGLDYNQIYWLGQDNVINFGM